MTTTTLAAGAVEAGPMISLLVIVLAAFLAPLASAATNRRIPEVVFLLIFGALIGPHGFAVASMEGGIGMLRELGLGMLFLLAGFEIDMDTLRGKQGRSATVSWLICAAMGFGMGLLVVGTDDLIGAVVIGLALTSTALGTLLPILKDAGEGSSKLGKAVMVHGAVGELGPIVAMALLLSARSTLLSALLLLAFVALAVAFAAVPKRINERLPMLGRAIHAGSHTTAQTALRAVVLVLAALMALAAVMELDVVLGAFAAGIIVRAVASEDDHYLENKLEVMAFSLLIPVFFVTSGMQIDYQAIINQPLLLAGFVVAIFLARGVPLWLREVVSDTHSGLTRRRNQIRLGLYGATGLPIIVAVTDVAVRSGIISPEMASVMVAGGAATVLLFPLAAYVLIPQESNAGEDTSATPKAAGRKGSSKYVPGQPNTTEPSATG